MNADSESDPPANSSFDAAPSSPQDTEENPYLSPSMVDEPPPVDPFISRKAPWSGGWLAVSAAVFAVTLFILAAGAAMTPGWIAIIFVPVIGQGALAVLVRVLHSAVDVSWPAYLAVSVFFALSCYVLFIPVCITVGLPVIFALENTNLTNSSDSASIGIFCILMVLGLLFALFLRAFMHNRWRRQILDQSIQWGDVNQTAPTWQRPSQSPPQNDASSDDSGIDNEGGI